MLITQNESEAIKMDVRQKRNKVLGERVVKALESRNMDAYYAETKEEAVKKALEALPQVDEAVVSHEKGTAVVKLNAEIADETLKKTVEDKDYQVVSVK